MRTHGFTLGGRCWTDFKLCKVNMIDPHVMESQNAGHQRQRQRQRQRHRYQGFGFLGHLKFSGYGVNGDEPKNDEIRSNRDVVKSGHCYVRVHL
jgi:hypothetical protein